jgi:hypothetical protein
MSILSQTENARRHKAEPRQKQSSLDMVATHAAAIAEG